MLTMPSRYRQKFGSFGNQAGYALSFRIAEISCETGNL
jgi:hypothetical protein